MRAQKQIIGCVLYVMFLYTNIYLGYNKKKLKTIYVYEQRRDIITWIKYITSYKYVFVSILPRHMFSHKENIWKKCIKYEPGNTYKLHIHYTFITALIAGNNSFLIVYLNRISPV